MHMRRKKIICLDQLDVAVDYIGLPELDRSRAFEGCVCVWKGGGGRMKHNLHGDQGKQNKTQQKNKFYIFMKHFSRSFFLNNL